MKTKNKTKKQQQQWYTSKGIFFMATISSVFLIVVCIKRYFTLIKK